MTQHFAETRNLVSAGKTSDSFAKHFASVCLDENKGKKKVSNKDVRELVEMSILWYGNPISCHKSFGKLSCRLCMKERILILEEMRKCKESGKKYLINSASELYGSCRHRPSFHRYSVTASTDEGLSSPKKSVSESSTSPPSSPPSPRMEDFDLPLCREVGSIDGSFSKRAVNMKGVSNSFSLAVDV